MKVAVKISFIMIVGLIVAVIIYPILHESGHLLSTIIVGGDVIEVNILPVPNVLCNIGNVSNIGAIIIALSGSIIPFVLSAAAKPKLFTAWYICFTVRWISLLSFIISMVSAFLFTIGRFVENEDVIQLLIVSSQYVEVYMIAFLLLAVADALLLIKSKPIQKMMAFIC